MPRAVQMELRHSNMLAMAHFLKTKTEPVLVSLASMMALGSSTNCGNRLVLQAMAAAP